MLLLGLVLLLGTTDEAKDEGVEAAAAASEEEASCKMRFWVEVELSVAAAVLGVLGAPFGLVLLELAAKPARNCWSC